MKAEWKTRGLFKADATKCYKEIKRMGENVTPQEIVDAARDESSELHKCFTWDNDIAADKWRKQEARMIAANLVVRYEDKQGKVESLRLITKSDKEGYTPTYIMARREEGYVAMLQRAKAELTAFKKKYHQLSELQEILDLINW